MRHFDVGDEDVGLVRKDGFERLLAVARFGDDGDVAFDFEQGGERAQHHPLIFGQNHADGLAAFFELSRGIQFWQPSSFRRPLP